MTDEVTHTEEDFYEIMKESKLGRDWFIWHKKNPDFFRLFKRFTSEALRNGHQRLSGWFIVNRVRWETTVVTIGDDFKIRNDYIALFTRLYMVCHPEHLGFFRTKKMKNLVRDIFVQST